MTQLPAGPSSGLYINTPSILVCADPLGYVQIKGTLGQGGGGALVYVDTSGPVVLEGFECSDNEAQYQWNAGFTTGQTCNLTLRRFRSINNSNGIITGNGDIGNHVYEDGFLLNNGDYDGLQHNLYANRLESLTCRRLVSIMNEKGQLPMNLGPNGDYSAYGLPPYRWLISWGHVVKSRAKKSLFDNCRLLQIDSESNRVVDLPNGGDATISNSVLQYWTTQNGPNNGQVIAFGVEGMNTMSQWDGRTHKLTVKNNVVVMRSPGWLFWVTPGLLDTPTSFDITGNTFVGFDEARLCKLEGGGVDVPIDRTTNRFITLAQYVAEGGALINSLNDIPAFQPTAPKDIWIELPNTRYSDHIAQFPGLRGNQKYGGLNAYCGGAWDLATGTFYAAVPGGHDDSAYDGIDKIAPGGGWANVLRPTDFTNADPAYNQQYKSWPAALAYTNAHPETTTVFWDQQYPLVRATSRHTYNSQVFVNGKIHMGVYRKWTFDAVTGAQSVANPFGQTPTQLSPDTASNAYTGQNVHGAWDASRNRYIALATQNGNDSKAWSCDENNQNFQWEPWLLGGYEASSIADEQIGQDWWFFSPIHRPKPTLICFNLTSQTPTQFIEFDTDIGFSDAEGFGMTFVPQRNAWLLVASCTIAGQTAVRLLSLDPTSKKIAVDATPNAFPVIAQLCYNKIKYLPSRQCVVWINTATENIREMYPSGAAPTIPIPPTPTPPTIPTEPPMPESTKQYQVGNSAPAASAQDACGNALDDYFKDKARDGGSQPKVIDGVCWMYYYGTPQQQMGPVVESGATAPVPTDPPIVIPEPVEVLSVVLQVRSSTRGVLAEKVL